MDDPLLLQLLLQVVLIALNAVFACAEIAVISMNDARLAKLSQSGDKRASRIVALTSQPARFLATIQVAITLSGFLGSAFAADNFSQRIVDALLDAGVDISAATLDSICVILITLLLSYFTLVFGELVPKRLAMKNPEKLALGMAGMLTVISRFFKPLVWLLTASTNGVLRLMRVDPGAEEDNVTEEEIRMMIDVGTEKGTIDAEEKTMLQNVFEFDDVSAVDIATHRTQMDALFLEDDDEVWENTINETRHSRYPVCGDSVDDIVGILNAKDYFRLKDRSRESVMANAIEEPHFIPETVKADVLFSNMKRRRNHFAVVLDEYGGVSGIVTMNDLLEEIVGDLSGDDGEEPECIFEKIDDSTWRMSGNLPLDTITDELHIELPNDEFDTLGGLVFGTLSAVPKDGSKFSCSVSGLDVNVLKVENHMITEAIVKLSEQ